MRRSECKCAIKILLVMGTCVPVIVAAGLEQNDSANRALTLTTSDQRLAAAFEWARRQALAYAFRGDPVGDWYEAALPGREAFCMRDTAHQAIGAHALGLAAYTRNMLRKFATNISDSKDWCSYWEINRDNLPAPVDYRDDGRFWYNLPANFDVLDACYRMYAWSGDRAYISDPAFLNFYRRTVHDYVDRWGLGTDRIMKRQRVMNVRGPLDPEDRFQLNRGIPSYEEGDPNFVVALDQVAVEYAGYLAYARLEQLTGNDEEAMEFLKRAEEIRSLLNQAWWDASVRNYYAHVDLNHKLAGHGLSWPALYYGAADDAKAADVLNQMLRVIADDPSVGIEEQSHFPETLYRYGKADAAYAQLLDLTRNGKNRREYPEVSYSVIGAIVTGLMGIEPSATAPGAALQHADFVDRTVTTRPGLTRATEWAELQHVPIGANEITVRHDGLKKTFLFNASGPAMIWHACFPGVLSTLAVDGSAVKTQRQTRAAGGPVSCVTVNVGSGDKRTVQAPE